MGSYTEHVTRVLTEDIAHERLGTVAVLRFASAEGSSRPASLGPQSIEAVTGAIAEALDRAEAGQVHAIALTGQGRVFLAGADLAMFADRELATSAVGPMTRAAHELQVRVRTSPVPVLAHLNGAALGGGLEVALMADVRTAGPGVRGIGLPETSLGILPGWGGTTLLTSAVGAEAGVRMILEDPARDKQLSAPQAAEIGLVDAIAADLTAALDEFAAALEARAGTGPDAGIGTGSDIRSSTPARPRGNPLPPAESPEATALLEALDAPHGKAETRREWATRLASQGAPAVQRALELLEQLPGSSLEDALAREAQALADLVRTDAAAGSLYAAELLRRGKPGRSPVEGARELRAVGVAGAGLMAAQIAAQLASGLQVPVVMRDLDEQLAQKGLEQARDVIAQAAAKGVLSQADATGVAGLLSATVEVGDFADCDLVIEAVPEVIGLKKQVFAEIEQVVGPRALLVSNTSSLRLTQMAADLRHPERVLGLHFFNPVAKMPLVEVVHTEATDEETVATGLEVVRQLRKFAVRSADAPGFIVNRLLFRVLSEVFRSLDAGADPQAVDASLDSLGMPMRPLTLLDLVGPGVGVHVGETFVRELGGRFHASSGLAAMAERGLRFTERTPGTVHPVPTGDVAEIFGSHQGAEAPVGEALLTRVQDALAEEIGLMLDQEVVDDVARIDLALILGAGFPRHRGGITPYLDQVGASQRAAGRTFHGGLFGSA